MELNFKNSLAFLLIVFYSAASLINAQSPSFKSYANPVIPGDHSDCTLSQIGKDFYTTGSSFNPTPVIYHSTDLVHWEVVAQPVTAEWSAYGDAPQGGCWGGQMVLYKNKYWDFFSRANTMYYVTADKPEGPWSMPVKVTNPGQLSYGLGYDNSIFIDDDGKWYMVVKNGQPNGGIVELGDDGQPTGVVYDLKWLNSSPSYPYSWAEGPVMWKHNGYYYYSFARDVSGGQKVMCSKTLTAEQSAWTTPVDFFNESDPGKSAAIFSGPNHSSAAVMLGDSTSWVVHPVWARNSGEWYGQGRQGILNQVRYNGDDVVGDYPANKTFTAPKLPSSGIPWMVPKSDFFATDKLHPEWSFLGQTASSLWSLTERPGWFRLKPKSATKANTIIKTDPEHNYSLITRLDFNPQATTDEAGIRIMNGMENMFAKLYYSVNAEGHKVVCLSFENINFEKDNNAGNVVWLKLIRVNHQISGFFSADGNSWTQVGSEINIAALDKYNSDWNGWCGNRQGLYVAGKSADFDLYIYRDAYSSILAECPANYSGTVRTKLNTDYVLDSIHNNDWALYAGVEFGTGEYAKASDSVMFQAACIAENASVEVWLDSIDTGTKIATCNIGNTGSLTTFKTFVAKTIQTTGRHDVYLKFVGASSGKLLILKDFIFTSKQNPQYRYSSAINDSTIILSLTQTVSKPLDSNGFEIYINGEPKDSIKNAKLSDSDSSLIVFTMAEPVSITDTLTITYSGGDVKSFDNLALIVFTDMPVDNLLKGSTPQVKLIQTNKTGDTIQLCFNKKMISPTDFLNEFKVNVNSSDANIVKSIVLADADSTSYYIILNSKVHYEDDVLLNYAGGNIKSVDNGLLKTFTSPVINVSDGYAPELKSVFLRKSGDSQNLISIQFTKTLTDVSTQKDYFTVTVNGNAVAVSKIYGGADTIQIKVNKNIRTGDTVKLSYWGGSVSTSYNGKLEYFTDYLVPTGSVSIKTLNNASINIYPNPLGNVLNIQSDKEFNELSVYDLNGKLVLNKVFGSKLKEASLEISLDKGVYLLQISNGFEINRSKIVVK